MKSKTSTTKQKNITVSKKLKIGDTVKIISGKEKDSIGKILKIFRTKGQLIVENVNCKKKHKKPTQEGNSGEIIEIEKPIHSSNVQPHNDNN
uniref:ribosomal protein L24 n=1 Tax=Pseudoerythrocladia kornmannii TaxID=753682 RepID=UPI001BF02F28|nr:ribosomal protein L24 [Pseudoerythrocladia kornmannii]QUE28270.1 ribosomal protein L24 [Pseudoerythrocladia kornmannii]UNJ16775.1 ribosomal protein L24 [Pseudoerythrocladia kornmannii]